MAAAVRSVEAARERASEMKADFDTRLANSKIQVDRLLAERGPALDGLTADIVRRYDRLRGSPARSAMTA